MKNGRRRKKEVEKSEAFHAIHEYFFFVPFSRGGRGKQTIFISLNTVNLGSRGVEKKTKRRRQSGTHTRHRIEKPCSNRNDRNFDSVNSGEQGICSVCGRKKTPSFLARTERAYARVKSSRNWSVTVTIKKPIDWRCSIERVAHQQFIYLDVSPPL